MDVNALQSKLENQPDRIIQILEALGFENIKFNPQKNNLRFAREEQRNPTSCLVDCATLRFFVFSTNQKGNIFSLIMDVKRCSFPDALKFAAIKAGLSLEELNIKTRWPFGGFFLKLLPNYEEEMEELETYPEEILEPYANKFCIQFVKDGISLRTQEKFGIGYDVDSNRITIPERAIDGSLVGIMGRANYECDHDKRWFPLISCPRSKTLFGYDKNYRRIQETQNLVLFESEKAVQQCDSFGSNIALATCGCHVSETQAKYIKRLLPKKILLAYDEGLEEEHLVNECKKLIVNNPILKTKVGYIWPDGLIPEGSKKNVADLGREAYQEGLTKYVKWVEE
jgi:DNA primase